MEKILIVGCKKAMDDVCIGCSRCLVGFNRKEGEFSRYRNRKPNSSDC
jgi:predicted metal-binding protein